MAPQSVGGAKLSQLTGARQSVNARFGPAIMIGAGKLSGNSADYPESRLNGVGAFFCARPVFYRVYRLKVKSFRDE